MAQIRQADDEDELVVDELKPGTKLLQGQYTIEKFINAGGFGITYLAKNSLDREVVIKECFPGSFCRRTQNMVTARSRAHQSQFSQIVKLFAQEAKSLSRLVHPNIVGVHQVFEDNDTAYMAIDFVDGRDLLEIIEKERDTLPPPRIISMVKKLLGAVAFIHDNGMLHRDISPDNILMTQTGNPILIDFGAARQQATKIGGKALSALRVVKDGYSPHEFYVTGSVQNASSDLYALAATFYHVITGHPPPDSQTRLVAIAEGGEDPYVPLAGRYDEYPEAFLAAMDTAVRVLPKDRIASARDWLNLIATKPELKVVPLNAETGVIGKASAGGTRDDTATEAGPTGSEAADASAATSGSGRKGMMIMAAAVVAAGAGFMFLSSGENTDTTAVNAVPAVASAAPAPESVSEPQTEIAASEDVTDVAPTVVADDVVEPEVGDAGSSVFETEVAAVAEEAPPPEAEVESEVAAETAPETATPDAAGPALAESEPEVAALPETEPEPEPAPEPEVVVATAPEPEPDPSVLSQQVTSAVWEVTLPFRTLPASAGGQFPQISDVVPLPGDPPANDWIVEGAVIYAVDGNWVTDEASIRDQIARDAEFGGDQFVFAPARIKTDPTSPFKEVTLAAAAVNHVTLANGFELTTKAVDSLWEVIVTKVPEGSDSGLRVGDLLVAELQSGTDLNAANNAFEVMLTNIARARWPQAIFSVERDGEILEAMMPLAKRK